MSDYLITVNCTKEIIAIQAPREHSSLVILDEEEHIVPTTLIRKRIGGNGGVTYELDASSLKPWTPNQPVLYTLDAEGQRERFGYVDIRADGCRLMVNNAPFYMRGYIRGITAHDHPNMLGCSERDYFHKNIVQAKKYGFNLVRFHSTIPDPAFVELADELGLFIHLEVGYSYRYDAHGRKQGLEMDERKWREVLLRYRNHPSVAIFCVGNELHHAGRNTEIGRMYQIGRELAPGKLIVDNAGWGEYDRQTSDIFIQHLGYYYPYKKHAHMFEDDACWRLNGSIRAIPLESEYTNGSINVRVRRKLTPIRPVLAHECLHYIDIPDYADLSRQYDRFAKRVGEQYVKAHGIEKPRYLDALPAMIQAKGLAHKMPDYIKASQHFKKIAVKTALERLRLSTHIVGYEMLQLSDCLKYENKNGLLDWFDEDKYLDAHWFRQFNDDAVLLAKVERETYYSGEEIPITLQLSNYATSLSGEGGIRVYLTLPTQAPQLVYCGDHVPLVSGLSTMSELCLHPNRCAGESYKCKLEVELVGPDRTLRNEWSFWIYPKVSLAQLPEMDVADSALIAQLSRLSCDAQPHHAMFLTDRLTDAALSALGEGRTVILNYHRDRAGNQYYLPGALDRYKPCIWDRGSHMGGVTQAAWFARAMGSDRYFDQNYYALCEGAYKINLDRVPFAVDELVWGVDKPVRDRMKGLIHGIKEFLPDQTLRNFSYLFALGVGQGHLIVCTFNLAAPDPASATALAAIINHAGQLKIDKEVSWADWKRWLETVTQSGPVAEDVMNHFWEIDNKPVEDTLFWEEAKIDIARLSQPAKDRR